MGYSVAVTAKSQKAKATMMAFMAEHYRPFHVVSGIGDRSDASAPTDDLSYCHGKLKLGIDYGCVSGPERKYVYGIIYFMALRIGRRVNFHGQRYPAYDYDSQDTVLLFRSTEEVEAIKAEIESSSYGWSVYTDGTGWAWSDWDERELACLNGGIVDGAKLPDPDPQYPNPFAPEQYDRVHEELKRLSALYEKLYKVTDGPNPA